MVPEVVVSRALVVADLKAVAGVGPPSSIWDVSNTTISNIRRAVSAQTIGNPGKDWSVYLDFCLTRSAFDYYDPYFEPRNGTTPRATVGNMTVILNEFQTYLYTVIKIVGVGKFMNRLARLFYENGYENDCFSAQALRRARLGIRNLIPKRERAIAREARQQDPITVDILWAMLQLCDLEIGPPSVWGREIWYRLMAFLGALSAFQLALRLSEYAHTPPQRRVWETSKRFRVVEDYNTLRPDDVSFRLTDGTILEAGVLRGYAGLVLEDVDAIRFKLRAAKNINGTTEEAVYAKGTTWWIDRFIVLHITWCVWARWEPEDIYFSIRFPLGKGMLKRLIARDIIALERSAVVQLNGDPRRYSTRSFKIGSMTTLYFAGASEEELWRNGRHASIAANRHYRRNLVPGLDARAGALGSTAAAVLTVADVQRARHEVVPRTQQQFGRR